MGIQSVLDMLGVFGPVGTSGLGATTKVGWKGNPKIHRETTRLADKMTHTAFKTTPRAPGMVDGVLLRTAARIEI